nr:hypothetical protein [uncultured Devosia sp.]
MPQLEQLGHAARAVVGDAQAALRAADEDAAQMQLLHRFARRDAAHIERRSNFGFGDALARGLVAACDCKDQAFLDFFGGRLAPLNGGQGRTG